MTQKSGNRDADRDERGTTLILALVFVFVVAIVLVAVGGLAANALLNTSNSRVQRTSAEDAESAVTVAMQYLRYNSAPHSPPSCLPPGENIPSADPRVATSDPVQVYCIRHPGTGTQTRIVDFYAILCPTGTSTAAGSCTTSTGSVLLHAQVTYDDLNDVGDDDCGSGVTTTCGVGMDVVTWDVLAADT
jgi:hypothetical protein